uniref:Uncharacterized protein n=1 Tax=Anguilla anguilla TaxID=7936 RepID=A0A0E9PWU2_ANGAN
MLFILQQPNHAEWQQSTRTQILIVVSTAPGINMNIVAVS